MSDPLCTIADVKQWLGIGPQEETSDQKLQALIEACSDVVTQVTGRNNLGSVQTYSENYRFSQGGRILAKDYPKILLRHFPVVSLTSVLSNNVSLSILVAADLQVGKVGVFVEDDGRTLTFLDLWTPPSYGYVQVNYTAGYDLKSNQTPQGLRQAVVQFVGEVMKSQQWIGYKSKSLAGEVVAFDMGSAIGMSPRTRAMLQPYIDRVPNWL